MRKNKGFTLVELLAVIVILAVIALIATPTVLSMIEEARKGAAESSMLSYVDQLEKQIVTNSMNSTKAVDYDGTYTIDGTVVTKTTDANVNFDLDIKGDQPQTAEGTTIVVSNGSVTSAKLKFGTYYVTYNFANKKASYCSQKNSFKAVCES